MKTNFEKAGQTVFTANGKNFEIVSFKTLRKKYILNRFQGKGYAYVEILDDGEKEIRAVTKP